MTKRLIILDKFEENKMKDQRFGAWFHHFVCFSKISRRKCGSNRQIKDKKNAIDSCKSSNVSKFNWKANKNHSPKYHKMNILKKTNKFDTLLLSMVNSEQWTRYIQFSSMSGAYHILYSNIIFYILYHIDNDIRHSTQSLYQHLSESHHTHIFISGHHSSNRYRWMDGWMDGCLVGWLVIV